VGNYEIPLFGEDYIEYSKFVHIGVLVHITARVQPKEWNPTEFELKVLSVKPIIPCEYNEGSHLITLKDGRYIIMVEKTKNGV
jgi:hypothetical protein